MNGLATRNRIRQASHVSVVRELDSTDSHTIGDIILACVGIAGVAWLAFELVQILWKALA